MKPIDEATDGPGFLALIVIGLLSLLAVCLFDVAAAYDRQTAAITLDGARFGRQVECSLASDGTALQRRIDTARGEQ